MLPGKIRASGAGGVG